MARATPDVDAVERVARVREYRLVLLEPRIEGMKVEHDAVGQVGIGRAKRGVLAPLANGLHREGVAVRRVDSERKAAVQKLVIVRAIMYGSAGLEVTVELRR